MAYSSRNATREAFQLGLIEDGELWMKMIQSRNVTRRVYDENTAVEMISLISEPYFKAFNQLQNQLQNKLNELRKKEA